MKDKSFLFHVPVELIKAEGEDEAWKIRDVASTPDQDLQGESIDQNGLDISVLKAGRGLFNYDHLKGPENVLGQIEDAEFVEQDGKKVLMVEGYLFKHQERAKAFHNILKSLKKGAATRVHLSVEGKIMSRDPMDSKQIKKARIEKVALTLDPVNPHTFAELVKSLNAPEETVEVPESTEEMISIKKSDLESLVEVAQKALSAGIGSAKAPEARANGEAMSKEDLDCKVKSVTWNTKPKKSKKLMIKSILDSVRKAHPQHDPMELAEWVLESFIDRLEPKGE